MMRANTSLRLHHRRRLLLLLGAAAVLVGGWSCNLLERGVDVLDAVDLDATVTEIQILQTNLAQTAAALPATAEALPLPVTAAATAVPPPAAPITPTVLETATAAPTVVSAPAANADERLMKSARILLFEDMSASRQIRLAKEALDRSDYFYLDVGSAKGWFKNQLLSGTDWDLVIAAAEAERDFGGEFFEYLDAHLERGGALIFENWDLDLAPLGRARKLLDRCGVEVQSDWFAPPLRVFYWTDPAHPLFSRPNPLPAGLRNAPAFWSGDIGDLLALKPSQEAGGEPASILASTNAAWNRDHGLLVACLGGRMVLQSFRSHEYHHDDIVALWQNYVDYTLRNHFSHMGQTAPPVAPTAAVPAAATPEITRGATPGPDYTFPHACGAGLTARMVRAPILQPDLFEHHALGIFMTVYLELNNTGSSPVQIWDGDYSLEAALFDKTIAYGLHRPATGYLFIEQPTNLYQDLVQPGETWRTDLVFDIDPAAKDWVFVLRPGFEFNETACEVRLPLTR